jgi:hypothetical protein
MSLRSFLRYSKILAPDALSFFYQGEFTDDFTDKIIELGEYNIESKKEVSKSRKKFSFLVAECFQNVVRHGKHSDASVDTNLGFFGTRNIGSTFIITSANPIDNSLVPKLEADLKMINAMDKDSLRAYYREILSDGEMSRKGGAGLGLIEMARRSGQQLAYKFFPINEVVSEFYLQIRIHAADDVENKDIGIDDSETLHNQLVADEILLLYKGDFASDAVMPVLNMIENNMHNQKELVKIRKRVYKMAVEVLQNIAQHALIQGEIKEGLFLIGKKDGHFSMATGNFIETAKVPALRENLAKLSALSHDELATLFKSTLFEGASDPAGRGGLGLVDVAREAGAALEYNFQEVDDKITYFSLAARL